MFSAWIVIRADHENKILYIKDDPDKHGLLSIVNDAENVIDHVHEHYGENWRIVYENAENDWGEMYYSANTWDYTEVKFREWDGEL